MGLPLRDYWEEDNPGKEKPWDRKSVDEKVDCLQDRLITPFSQRTLEMVGLLVSLHTIDIYIEQFGDDVPVNENFPQNPGTWGNWWEIRFPDESGIILRPTPLRPPPHQFYSMMYMQQSIFKTRKQLAESIVKDPDKYRDSKPIDELVRDEDLMPALRSMKEFATSKDLSHYQFIVRHAMGQVANLNHICETIRRYDTVKELPQLPRLVKLPCFPFLDGHFWI